MENKKKKEDSLIVKISLIAITCVCSLIIGFNLFLGDIGLVDGSSMYPTIQDGEMYISFNTKKVEKGDIIILGKTDEHNELIKRLIALPGDTIKIEDGVLYINNEVQTEDYIKKESLVEDFDEITLKDDEYFFMGDNRLTSKDARVYGAASLNDINGKVLYHFPSLQNFFN